MLRAETFYELLVDWGIKFFTGVPDSLLKNFCAYISDHVPPDRHVISVNEGAAVALACGHHLATGAVPLVYMQNSGQGNAVNPLMSLADPEVYGMPVLLVIGWRGEPGVKDEPQHVKQGKVTLPLLEALQIPYEVLPGDEAKAEQVIGRLFDIMNERKTPGALVVRKNTFDTYQLRGMMPDSYVLSREEAVKLITQELSPADIVVSTTGKASRELYEFREESRTGHERDFLTVGSMGHASQIALGIAMARPDRQVVCFDGDGAALMHLGSLAITGTQGNRNYKHIIFNNGAHDSVGGQPTVGLEVSFCEIASACGYKRVGQASTREEILNGITKLMTSSGPALLEIKVNKGSRPDLGRPEKSPQENKHDFMEFVNR